MNKMERDYVQVRYSHPGEIVAAAMGELDIGVRELARAMDIAPSAISRLLAKERNLSPELAIKLSVVLGSTPESWMKMQIYYSLQEAEKAVDTSILRPLRTSNLLRQRP
ncbi:HigA family addiction module antitoxin [Rouxiella badensis]|jgi:addiction module HigA family antidote|uniref:HigA family addiction module antitoxin n=1 Tax=Rouxiella badensis TaxID=1646377 RepID=UPI00036A0D10|nr:HigA family addiction module antitoxin [Rouxiella badensis]MCC3703054.1 HigA family addiction module antitoxin [Rouxiella badensis]MCC3721205.1 HigA family addiction module antitoxin [Rouxiella badensis]MCC3730900.1 HigA family addiction module antitoxin [Rouxiella badensis]MCC3734573.1 HigA family addiction module antitoxin [Rouxiella badensis]MCC3742442.1 HigA family addiction module antitoxin [Rouxiella badensis]